MNLFATISRRRLLFYMGVTALLPLAAVLYYYTGQRAQLLATEAALEKTWQKALYSKQKLATSTLVRKLYKGADHFYIDHELETMTLLKKEQEALERLIHSKTFTGNEPAEERYAFVSGERNRLLFTEGSVQKAEGIEEIQEYLAHPVEIDSYDLKEILTRIENHYSGKPQLFITDFLLAKKAALGGSEVFELNLKLIKREFDE